MKSSPALQQPQRITFDEDGIEGETILSSGQVKWEAIIEATESEQDFYFFTSKKFAYFVPKLAFENKDDLEALRELAIKRLGEKAINLIPARA